MATLESAIKTRLALRDPAWYGRECADEDRRDIEQYGCDDDPVGNANTYAAEEALTGLRDSWHYETALEPDSERAWLESFMVAYAERGVELLDARDAGPDACSEHRGGCPRGAH